MEHLNDNFQRSALTSPSASSCLDLCKSHEDEIFIIVTSTKDINWCWNDEKKMILKDNIATCVFYRIDYIFLITLLYYFESLLNYMTLFCKVPY